MKAPKLYRWPDNKPLPAPHGLYAWPAGGAAARDFTGLFRWHDRTRRVEVIRAFWGHRVAEVEIGECEFVTSRDLSGDDLRAEALASLAVALTPDALDVMHESQVAPLPQAIA